MIRNNVKVYHCIFSDIWHHKVQNSQSQLSKYRITQNRVGVLLCGWTEDRRQLVLNWGREVSQDKFPYPLTATDLLSETICALTLANRVVHLLVFSGSNQGIIYTEHVKISCTEGFPGGSCWSAGSDSIGPGWGLSPLSALALRCCEQHSGAKTRYRGELEHCKHVEGLPWEFYLVNLRRNPRISNSGTFPGDADAASSGITLQEPPV